MFAGRRSGKDEFVGRLVLALLRQSAPPQDAVIPTKAHLSLIVVTVDYQARYDLKWVGIWAAMTLVFGIAEHFKHHALWISGIVITVALWSFYGVFSFNAWRDRIAEAERDHEPNR